MVLQERTSLRSLWLQPKIDRALHLNWTRRRNEAYYEKWDNNIPDFEDTPLLMHISLARWYYGMRVSLVAELLVPFDLRELLDSPPPSIIDSVPFAIQSLPVGEAYESASVVDTELIIRHVDDNDRTIDVTLVAISLHIDRAAALESGLFGLLADATVQTIDYDDVPQLRQFYQLFSSDSALKEAEPQVEKMFNVLLSSGFQVAVLSWKAKVKWLLQAVTWREMQELKTFGDTDPQSVWTPPVPKEQTLLRMDQFMPDEDHSWWEEHVESKLPHVVPQIMVRLCDNQCYSEERRPEMFGEVWLNDRA